MHSLDPHLYELRRWRAADSEAAPGAIELEAHQVAPAAREAIDGAAPQVGALVAIASVAPDGAAQQLQIAC